MKKSYLGKIIAITCMIAVVVVGAVLVKSTSMVTCPDCDGYGYVHNLPCADCKGEGTVDGENCGTCEAEGTLAVKALNDSAELSADKAICETCGETGEVPANSNYYATIVALLAPLIAIILALITKEVYSSLFIGIVIGGLFATNFSPIKTVDAVINDGLIGAVSGLAGIFLFLVLLGVMVALINKSGEARHLVNGQKRISNHVRALYLQHLYLVYLFS